MPALTVYTSRWPTAAMGSRGAMVRPGTGRQSRAAHRACGRTGRGRKCARSPPPKATPRSRSPTPRVLRAASDATMPCAWFSRQSEQRDTSAARSTRSHRPRQRPDQPAVGEERACALLCPSRRTPRSPLPARGLRRTMPGATAAQPPPQHESERHARRDIAELRCLPSRAAGRGQARARPRRTTTDTPHDAESGISAISLPLMTSGGNRPKLRVWRSAAGRR